MNQVVETKEALGRRVDVDEAGVERKGSGRATPRGLDAMARFGARLRDWHRAAVLPRLQITRLLPSAGAGLIVALVAINIMLGLLPVAFMLATSVLVGQVPAAVSAGVDSPAFDRLSQAFLLAAAAFFAQQVLAPVQTALGQRMKRRVDGRLRDETVSVAMQATGIAPMEDPETLDALSETTRLFEADWNTPGMACAGQLALIARYLRLAALLAIVGVVASWPAAAALGGAVMLFRYGNRGGLRKYSVLWREMAGVTRRAQYLRDLALGAAAAKELRIFGLVPWLTQRYSEAFAASNDPVCVRRRQIYLKPYLIYTPIGLAVGTWIIVLLAGRAAAEQIALSELMLGVQAVIMALLLGEFYPESDMQTQWGMQAVAALDEVRQRSRRFGAPSASSRSAQSPPSPAPDAAPPCIRFEDISFQYPGGSMRVLDGLNLELPAGKCTAIVGVNGAGKTTLVKLLTRLYEPTRGTVTADGIAIGAIDPAAWRCQVGVIFQDFIRYELSAADNIALGAVHAPIDRALIERAAADAGILEALSGMPLGLDTPLARAYTGGIDLSGGQWQRVAVARSLYALRRGARVLILDEPTAALDVRAEVEFFDKFVELTQGVTSLLISHRFSSVRRADRIVVVDGGRVSEQGSHAQLMARDGEYARLFRLQAERFAAGLNAEGERMEAGAEDAAAAQGLEKGRAS